MPAWPTSKYHVAALISNRDPNPTLHIGVDPTRPLEPTYKEGNTYPLPSNPDYIYGFPGSLRYSENSTISPVLQSPKQQEIETLVNVER
jgi:hypothetical protein